MELDDWGFLKMKDGERVRGMEEVVMSCEL